jgi:tetratricopeptide (TPR) repeat protein
MLRIETDESSDSDTLLLLTQEPDRLKPKPKQPLELNSFDEIAIKFYISTGWECINKEKYGDALYNFNEMLKLDPECDRAHSGIGSVYYKQQKYPEAIHKISDAIAINPNVAMDYLVRANAHFALKHYDAAIKDCKTVIQLNQPDSTTYRILANSYFRQKKYQKAVTAYNNAILINPKHYEYFSQRGEVHTHLGNIPNAIKDYKKALTLNSTCPFTIKKLNNLLSKINSGNLLLATEIEKETLFAAIKRLPETDQLHWLNQCQERTTGLGSIMYKPRSSFVEVVRFFGGNPEYFDFIKCDKSKGMLKKISQQIEILNRNRGIDTNEFTKEMISITDTCGMNF